MNESLFAQLSTKIMAITLRAKLRRSVL